MRAYVLTHLSDDVLVRDLTALVARDRETTAALLAHLAEVDARRLYVPAGYPSMHAYCVGQLRFSDDAAFKRIQVARAARQFPEIFAAIADGRLHLTAVRTIAPYLTPDGAGALLAAAAHRSMAEVEELIARRFGPVAAPALSRVTAVLPSLEPSLGMADSAGGAADAAGGADGLAAGPDDEQVLRPVEFPRELADFGAERFNLQLSIDRATRDKLEYARSLLGHAEPSGDLAKVVDRALDALIAKLERQKFAATSRPRGSRPARAGTRYIPSHVKRAVWERDGGRCTFVSDDGVRCPARTRLEFDHVELFARGGEATVEGLRLRCQAHNQYAAERALGRDFMNEKRAEARQARAAGSRAAIEARRNAALASDIDDDTRAIYSGLRNLGCRADEARRASEHAASLGPLAIEERLRAAIQFIGKKPGGMSKTLPGNAPGNAPGPVTAQAPEEAARQEAHNRS